MRKEETNARGVDFSSASGADRVRTDDLLLAKQLLFQLSYGPAFWVLIFR